MGRELASGTGASQREEVHSMKGVSKWEGSFAVGREFTRRKVD